MLSGYPFAYPTLLVKCVVTHFYTFETCSHTPLYTYKKIMVARKQYPAPGNTNTLISFSFCHLKPANLIAHSLCASGAIDLWSHNYVVVVVVLIRTAGTRVLI